MNILRQSLVTFVLFGAAMIHARSARRSVDCPDDVGNPMGNLHVFLTVSPLTSPLRNVAGDSHIERQIELNWQNGPVFDGDWVGLFSHDPTNDPTEPLVRVFATHHPGYYRTHYQDKRRIITNEMLTTEKCMDYWIGYVRAGRTILVNCLRTRPTWMWDMRDKIGDTPLYSLLIPGTHNAGSYQEYRGIASENAFTRYLVTQDEYPMAQLIHGIRYFDLRVAYYPEQRETFWLNHNFYRMNPLSELVREIKQFLSKTNEIVILDFHRHPIGFQARPERHHLLAAYLESELKPWLASPNLGRDVTPNDLWLRNRTLILAYNDENVVAKYKHLYWPPIYQAWGNKQDVESLRSYLNSAVEQLAPRGEIWSVMAELTPSPLTYFIRPTESLRMFAHRVNRNVTAWSRDIWWRDVNVVAVDFFRGTDIVNVAIDANEKRVVCRSTYHVNLADQADQQALTDAEDRRAELRPTAFYQGPRQMRAWIFS